MYIINIFSLLTLVVFYFSYFTKQILLSRSGISSNRLGKGVKDSASKIFESILLVLTFATAILQFLSSIFYQKMLFSLVLNPITRILGILISFLGCILFILSITHMKNNWRAGVDSSQKTSLVTNGIYKYSRNPAFLGFYLLYIGSFLSSPNLLLLFAIIITIIFFHLQILKEEIFLKNSFGNDYIQYKSKVKRYF